MTEPTAGSVPGESTHAAPPHPLAPGGLPEPSEAPGAAIGRDEQGQDRHNTDRVVFFSDAVVAIAITLLALELPVPSEGRPLTLWHAIEGEGYVYLSFLISFLIIANNWVSHHHLFAYVKHIDRRAIRLNIYWLMFIVITPFSTRFMTGGHDDSPLVKSIRFGVYALVQTLVGLFLLLLARYLRTHDMLVPGAVGRMRAAQAMRMAITIAFAVSVAAAFVQWWLAPVCWLLMGPTVGITRRVVLARAGPDDQIDVVT